MYASFKALLPLIMPFGVSDYFELSQFEKDDIGIHVYLEELVSHHKNDADQLAKAVNLKWTDSTLEGIFEMLRSLD